MKSVLKRRKHRKGIRPKRKGTLKVNLQELPTKAEHRQAIELLMARKDKFANLDDALEHLKKGNKIEFDRIIRISKGYGVIIGLMQKGYDYFREHKQIDGIDLALSAINGESPKHFIRKEFDRSPTCKACTHDCPFTNRELSEDKLIQMCPFVRYAFRDYVLDENNILPLTQSDMAELALTHLS